MICGQAVGSLGKLALHIVGNVCAAVLQWGRFEEPGSTFELSIASIGTISNRQSL